MHKQPYELGCTQTHDKLYSHRGSSARVEAGHQSDQCLPASLPETGRFCLTKLHTVGRPYGKSSGHGEAGSG